MPERNVSTLKVRLVTDVFPPQSGGSGWSTYYLGKALAERGHTVTIVRPIYGKPLTKPTRKTTSSGGLPVEEIHVPSPPGCITRVGFGRVWEERKAVRLLVRHCTDVASAGEVDVLHGQHRVSGLAASLSAQAARRRGARVVSVVTVRDYWPLCPSSTRLLPASGGRLEECRDCDKFSVYFSCLSTSGKLRVGSLVGAARWLRTHAHARTLSQCDAIIAVSNYVRSELERSGRFAPERLHTIHNLVALDSVDEALAQADMESRASEGPYLLFAGKLDEHKGAQLLPEVIEAAGIRMPVLFAGDGPLQPMLQTEGERRGLDFRFLDWLDNDAVLRLMQGARCLLFPSCWQEPLSRVLLEGSAAGAAIVALDSGGTGDVITHNVSGWLAQDTTEFIEGVRRVCTEDDLNQALRRGARDTAVAKFPSPVVSRQVEDLYRTLLTGLGTA